VLCFRTGDIVPKPCKEEEGDLSSEVGTSLLNEERANRASGATLFYSLSPL
jgi:hypothetical protein